MAFTTGFETLEELLGEMALMSNLDTGEEAPGGPAIDNSLRLSTIHQAKGLEWKAVFVLFVNEDMFPSKKATEETGDAEHHDEKQNQRRVRHGPGGEIKSLHRTLGMSAGMRLLLGMTCPKTGIHFSGSGPDQNDSDETTRTFWAGSSFCTPSTTTLAPSSTPPVIMTSLVS